MARSVPAVVRALDVLELFLDGRTNLSAPEVATALGLPRTTVHELLATLVEREYVERLPDNAHRFRLGLRVFELGNTYAEALDVVRDGQSVVDEVAARCGETCQLAVLDGRDVVYVAKADGSHDLRVQAPVGRRFTALRTAAGRVLLAHLPWTDLDRRFPVRPVAAETGPGAVGAPNAPGYGVGAAAGAPGAPRGPVRPVAPLQSVARPGWTPAGEGPGLADVVVAENSRLRRELAAIGQRGVGQDPGGAESMVRSVAAAIRDHLGHVVAAVEISVPVARWDPQRFATLEGLVRRAAARASARLGYRPPRVIEESAPVAAATRTRRAVTTSRLDQRLPGDPAGPLRAGQSGHAGQPGHVGQPVHVGHRPPGRHTTEAGPRRPGGPRPAVDGVARPGVDGAHRSPGGPVGSRPGGDARRDDAGRDVDRSGQDRSGQDRSGQDRPDRYGPDRGRRASTGHGGPPLGVRAPLAGPRLRQLPTLPEPG